jgi:hypothetical protein
MKKKANRTKDCIFHVWEFSIGLYCIFHIVFQIEYQIWNQIWHMTYNMIIYFIYFLHQALHYSQIYNFILNHDYKFKIIILLYTVWVRVVKMDMMRPICIGHHVGVHHDWCRENFQYIWVALVMYGDETKFGHHNFQSWQSVTKCFWTPTFGHHS